MRTKFIVFEGVDNVGKSTMLERTLGLAPNVREIRFQKSLPISGDLLRINTEKDFMLLSTLFPMLDPSNVYVLDRFLLSNLVYDGVLRGENTDMSLHYYKKFKEENNVLEVILTRDPITTDFVDDRISMSMDQFNALIEEYRKYGENHQVLWHNADGITVDQYRLKAVMEQIEVFVKTRFEF